MVGVTFRPEAIRSALPPMLEPAESMSGGFVAINCTRNSRLPPFEIAHAWIDVKGYNTPEGAPGRYVIGGLATGAAASLFGSKLGSVRLLEAGASLTRTGGELVSETRHSAGSSHRVGTRRTSRSFGVSSYHVHYLGVAGDRSVRTMPLTVFNEFDEAEPITAEMALVGPSGTLGLVPTGFLWGARPRQATFVQHDSFTGASSWNQRARERAAGDRLLALVNCLDGGAVLLDADGLAVLVNDAARAILGDGISLAKDRLVVAVGQQEALDALVTSALSPATAPGSLEPIAVKRMFGRKPLLLQAVPIGPCHMHTLDISPGSVSLALILITDLDRPVRASTRELELLGLTPAEARVAAAVGSGLSPRQASQRLGISESTTRSALNLVYGKLMIGRQSELALIVARFSVGNWGETRPAEH